VGGSTKGWVRVTQIRRTSELVFLFDGLLGLNYHAVNANRINARHKKATMTNVAFFDGHVESIYTKEIPGGLGDANAGGTAQVFSLDNCNKFRRVLWRMDQ
jgi:prepilin-type processing-associated H-X9-DG protein